tara:strand:- start:243 stop:380 length:138 start_codon:yes stop_codon:yes gene_type:complete
MLVGLAFMLNLAVAVVGLGLLALILPILKLAVPGALALILFLLGG